MEEKHRGTNLSESSIDLGLDSVCCRENLHKKGPGVMLHRFGIDARLTEEKYLPRLIEDYLENSSSVFTETEDKKVSV